MGAGGWGVSDGCDATSVEERARFNLGQEFLFCLSGVFQQILRTPQRSGFT